ADRRSGQPQAVGLRGQGELAPRAASLRLGRGPRESGGGGDPIPPGVCDTCLPERRGAAGTIGRRRPKDAPTDADWTAGRQARREAARYWEEVTASEPGDRSVFELIRARLRNVPIGVIAAATGLSQSYCSRIRNGPVTPHPRHWLTLRSIVDPN